MRKGEQARDEVLKDVNSQILRDGAEVGRVLVEAVQLVQNVEDVTEANINISGDWRMPVMGVLY